jgi:hypothetical protein
MRLSSFVLGLSLLATLAVAAFPSKACDADHWIEEVLGDGAIIKLEDGSLWQVDSVDEITAVLWLPTTEVVVCDDKIINTDDNESVQVRRLK